MRPVLRIFALVAATAICGCRDSPSEVYSGMAEAARKGDEEAFLAAFTEESARVVRAVIHLSREYGFQRKDPFSMLAMEDVVDERIDGDTAVLTVNDGNATRQLLMKKSGGKWRIDIFELEKFWEKGQ